MKCPWLRTATRGRELVNPKDPFSSDKDKFFRVSHELRDELKEVRNKKHYWHSESSDFSSQPETGVVWKTLQRGILLMIFLHHSEIHLSFFWFVKSAAQLLLCLFWTNRGNPYHRKSSNLNLKASLFVLLSIQSSESEFITEKNAALSLCWGSSTSVTIKQTDVQWV